MLYIQKTFKTLFAIKPLVQQTSAIDFAPSKHPRAVLQDHLVQTLTLYMRFISYNYVTYLGESPHNSLKGISSSTITCSNSSTKFH